MSNYRLVECSIENQVATVTLNRPPLNPLNKELFYQMVHLMEELEQNPEVRVVIITGSGEKAFAAGADINEMSQLDFLEMSDMCRVSRNAFDKIESLSKPVIAAINGLALGGGFELALACDFRISGDTAKFAFPEINLGIIPGGGGTQRLQRLIGQARAKEILFLGEMISAEKAYEYGIVNQVVPREEVLKVAREWAGKLAEKPRIALHMIKTSVNVGANSDLDSALYLEAACFASAFASEDRVEGMKAFAERRKPNFVGR